MPIHTCADCCAPTSRPANDSGEHICHACVTTRRNHGHEPSTLTRGEALDMIHAAESAVAFESCLRALSVEWIGHAQDGAHPFEIAELLREYVAECALSDDVRSNGPQDSDDTGIPS